MAINYNWEVTSMSTIAASPTEPNYVVQANYSVIATSVEQPEIFSIINDAAFFTPQEGQPNYIPYEDLTNDIVIGWVKAQLGENGVLSVEETLAAQVEALINPTPSPEPTPLPW